MAAVCRLSRSTVPLLLRGGHRLGGSRYCSARGVGGAAEASIDVDLFTVPLSSMEDMHRQEEGRGPQWVFLGCPGVGKGTYASRLAKVLNVPHIAMGDLVRQELKTASSASLELANAVAHGKLLPDNVIFDLLSRRLERGMTNGERGFILDGFPRTVGQAEVLDDVAEIDLIVNLQLREDIIVAKCLGRRMCSDCGGNFNFANIDVGGQDGEPRTVMPPLMPPNGCLHKMTIRSDDTEEVVRARLDIYHEESSPLDNYYRVRGKLIDFNVGGGIKETWNHLLTTLNIQDKSNHVEPSKKLAA